MFHLIPVQLLQYNISKIELAQLCHRLFLYSYLLEGVDIAKNTICRCGNFSFSSLVTFIYLFFLLCRHQGGKIEINKKTYFNVSTKYSFTPQHKIYFQPKSISYYVNRPLFLDSDKIHMPRNKILLLSNSQTLNVI